MNGAPARALGIPGRVRPGEWLKKQRVGAGLTQEDLAKPSGVPCGRSPILSGGGPGGRTRARSGRWRRRSGCRRRPGRSWSRGTGPGATPTAAQPGRKSHHCQHSQRRGRRPCRGSCRRGWRISPGAGPSWRRLTRCSAAARAAGPAWSSPRSGGRPGSARRRSRCSGRTRSRPVPGRAALRQPARVRRRGRAAERSGRRAAGLP